MTKLLTQEKLTAYLLDELDDLQRRAVEDALEEDAEARQTLAELEAASQLVMDVFGTQPEVSLTETQRREIHESARGTSREAPPAPSPRPQGTNRGTWAAVAAFVLVLGGGVLLVNIFGTSGGDLLDAGPRAEEVRVADATFREEAREKIDRQLKEQQDRIRTDTESLDGVVDGFEGVTPAEDAMPETDEAEDLIASHTGTDELHPTSYNGRRSSARERALERRRGKSTPQDRSPGTESYSRIAENTFRYPTTDPLSTFSIDVDTASYANIRRFVRSDQLPPRNAVRIEEMVNYFSYDYPQPRGYDPFATHVEIAGCPWNSDHRLARIGIQGRDMAPSRRPPTNLVFLLDVSGSMSADNKLPLLKQAMKLLLLELDERDRVSIVVYASDTGLVLPPTPCNESATIFAALDGLEAKGRTNGGSGIRQAYDTAAEAFIEGGVNRVILATDGDFNVGITDRRALTHLIKQKADGDIFLTILGFGIGNLKDATMEQLADEGNGNYAYIDTLNEAQKVLVDELTATLVTIAKDVKIQVEFNPAQVQAYRLIGYENRILAARDFNDDSKDAGEIGAGHSVTALYEIVPAGTTGPIPGVDPLKYQQSPDAPPSLELSPASWNGELMTVKLRYKQPTGTTSRRLSFPVTDDGDSYACASADFKFAASVAAFGMLLRDSPYKGTSSYDGVLELAEEGIGGDRFGYREEFIEVVEKARSLSSRSRR